MSERIIYELEQHLSTFDSLLKVQSAEEILWKADPKNWCLLEVVCHLVDEEMLDFRTRVKAALNPSQYPFIPIDPVAWVKEKNYMGQNYEAKVAEWKKEREASLAWLRSLGNPDWESALQHPELGSISAGRFLANWLAHDYIHIRQILKIRHAYLMAHSREDLTYAGKW